MAVDFEKVKERLADLLYEAKELARRAYDDFRAQTPYFKARVGVAAGYVGLVVLTLVVAPPPSADNPIDASVRATALPWGLRDKTVIEVRNQSDEPYEKLQIVVEGVHVPDEDGSPVPGRWTYNAPTLGPGKAVQLTARDLVDAEGRRPALDFVPQVIEVRCSDGVYRDKVRLYRVH